MTVQAKTVAIAATPRTKLQPTPATFAVPGVGRPHRRHERLRVLEVIDSLVLGGAERHLVIVARYLDPERYDVRVLSLYPLLDTPIEQALRANGTPLYTIDTARRHTPVHVPRVAELVRREGIDLVHTHLNYANTIGTLGARLAGRPVVSTLHNVHNVYANFAALKGGLQTQAMRWGAHTIIACAPEVRTMALEAMHLPRHKVVDLPYGIETDRFDNLDPAAVDTRRRELLGDGAAAGPLVVSVGNLLASKGHEYLVSALAQVVRQVGGVRLAIVGRSEENEAVVRARIAELGLGDHVVLTGQRPDVAEIVAAADLFVLSSLWEGLPLAMLEAMAAGKPIVATAVGGIPGAIDDGVNGRLIQPADVDGLAAAMSELLLHPAEARRLGDAARRRVDKAYRADMRAGQLGDIYDAAMRDHAAGTQRTMEGVTR